MLIVAALCSLALVEHRQGRAPSAGLPVRADEGTLHGFVELRTAAGAPLANGDLLQTVHDGVVESRLVFHFPDSSVFDESVTFTQHGVFAMEHYHLIQSGPAFADDLTADLVAASGEYHVLSRSHKDGKQHDYSGTMDVPADTYNGMVIIIAKNLVAGDTQAVHVVAFTPQPRVIGLEIAPTAFESVMLGRHTETAVHFKLKPKLGALLRVFATLVGQAPPDSDVWIINNDVPAFARFEGPMYTGPVWHLTLTSPTWRPAAERASTRVP